MTTNWKGFGKKWSWSNRVVSRDLSGRTEENHRTFRIACVSAEIQTEHLQDTSQERYVWTNLLGLAVTLGQAVAARYISVTQW
jgi:hypothetical protein